MKKNNAFLRAAALLAALSITVSLAAPAFAGTYYIDNGDITITKKDDGSQEIKQNGTIIENDDRGEIVITTSNADKTTLESDLEGPAAEDSGFGPVVEDNYQPAQPESTEEPEGADQQESAGQQAQPQQAAPAAAPAASTPQNDKGNGFWGNTITVINNFANTVLNLTLKDVKIDVSDDYISNNKKAALSVQGKGDVEIELDGKNELKSGNHRAGLEKNTSTSTGTLTLKDSKGTASGSLKAEGGSSGAGIGGGYGGGSKNIIINGGTVTAAGDWGAAGIGGGYGGGSKNIIINGGTVNATGGYWGAGIGGGDRGSGEDITITGGTVTAVGGNKGAGIGGGQSGSGKSGNGKNITIKGGTVTATGGDYGAGIGGGSDDGNGYGHDGGSGEDITIVGGTVTAVGGIWGAGIGGSVGGSGKNITIKGGTVTAGGGRNGAGIGGSARGSGKNITIDGGTVNAQGGENGAGIGGGGSSGIGDTITINGGTVTATGGYQGAGIGGGNTGIGDTITINGGTVNATGGIAGAGIGGGQWSNGENITISGGTVTAAGGALGAGIGGGGYGGIGSKVTVSGAAQVTATATASKDPDWSRTDTGATIGNGSTRTPDGDPVNGDEIRADISGLTTGYINHIIYDENGNKVKEWWEPERPQPNPEDPNAPAEESNEVDLGTPWLYVETLEGGPLPFNARQQGSTLRVTTDNLAARLYGTRQALEAMREQGVEQIQFVTTLKTTTLSVEDLLAEGGSWFALEHNGLGSRQLSTAQAESLKCRMR